MLDSGRQIDFRMVEYRRNAELRVLEASSHRPQLEYPITRLLQPLQSFPWRVPVQVFGGVGKSRPTLKHPLLDQCRRRTKGLGIPTLIEANPVWIVQHDRVRRLGGGL